MTGDAAARDGTRFFRAALAYADVRLLVASNAVSTLGDWLYSVGFVVYVLEATGSAAWVAAAGMMRLAPHLLFGTIGGAVADRYERRALMVVADVARAALMIAMGVAAVAGAPAAVVIALAFLTTTATTVYDPAASAVVPTLVREEDLAAANTVLNVVENVALALGPALGGFLLLLGEPEVAFFVNAGTFSGAALLVRMLSVRSQPQVAAAGESLWRSAAEGVQAARSSSDVSLILGVFFVVSLLYGQETVLLVLSAERLLGMGPEGTGFLYAAIGAGGIAGAAMTSRLARNRRPGGVLALGLAVSGLSFVGLGLASAPAVGIAVMAFDGIGAVLIEVLSVTMLQRLVTRDVLGRTMGLVDVLSVAGGLVGAVLAPVLVDALGLRGALLAGGALLPATALVALPKFREMNVRAERSRVRMAETASFLGGIRIFDGATPQALELVAQGAETVVVGAGAEVVREGDAADAFFVVRRGEFLVYSRGDRGGEPEVVNTLGPGDYFGEIGLLERIPRTATVVSSSPSELLRVDGDDFAAVFAPASPVRGPLMATAAARLARTHPSYRPDR